MSALHREDENLVFGNPDSGQVLDHSSLVARFKRALKRAGLWELCFDPQRHPEMPYHRHPPGSKTREPWRRVSPEEALGDVDALVAEERILSDSLRDVLSLHVRRR